MMNIMVLCLGFAYGVGVTSSALTLVLTYAAMQQEQRRINNLSCSMCLAPKFYMSDNTFPRCFKQRTDGRTRKARTIDVHVCRSQIRRRMMWSSTTACLCS